MRKHDSLEKDIIMGIDLPGKRTRPKTSWMNNIITWTGLTYGILRKTEERNE